MSDVFSRPLQSGYIWYEYSVVSGHNNIKGKIRDLTGDLTGGPQLSSNLRLLHFFVSYVCAFVRNFEINTSFQLQIGIETIKFYLKILIFSPFYFIQIIYALLHTQSFYAQIFLLFQVSLTI